jgi:hypothetical protein
VLTLHVSLLVYPHAQCQLIAADVDLALQQQWRENGEHFRVVIVLDEQASSPVMHWGIYRHAWLRVSSSDVVRALDELVAPQLWRNLASETRYTSQKHEKASFEERKVIRPSAEYRLAFYLMNEDPKSLIAEWNFNEIYDCSFSRALCACASLNQAQLLSVDSLRRSHQLQSSKWIRKSFITLPSNENRNAILPVCIRAAIPRTHRVRARVCVGFSYLVPSELPEFLDQNKWPGDFTATTQPTLTFIVFIPSRANRPLHFVEPGSGRKLNAFIIPQLAGIAVHNANITERRHVFTPHELQVSA